MRLLFTSKARKKLRKMKEISLSRINDKVLSVNQKMLPPFVNINSKKAEIGTDI